MPFFWPRSSVSDRVGACRYRKSINAKRDDLIYHDTTSGHLITPHLLPFCINHLITSISGCHVCIPQQELRMTNVLANALWVVEATQKAPDTQEITSTIITTVSIVCIRLTTSYGMVQTAELTVERW